MEVITYIVVSLDSRPMEGLSCQEQVEQLILLASWTVSPRDCVMKKKLEWEPVITQAYSYNLDSRPMEGTTYLEHPALAVYLDSWPMEGEVRSKKLDCEPVIIPAINHNLDSRPMEGTTYLEHPAPAVYLDSWPLEGEVRKKKLEWEPVITPADKYTPDNQPMEGMTYLEHPAPAVYLDSWLVRRVSYTRPHVDWEVLNSKPSLNNVTIVKMVDTDASDDVNTHLPDKVTPMSTPMTAPAWPCVDSPRLPTVKHEIVNRMKDTREMEMTLPENAPPTIDPNVTRKNPPVSIPMMALVWPCVNSPRWSTVKTEIVNRKKDSRAVDTTLSKSTLPTIDPNVSMKNSPEYVTPVSTPMTALVCVNSPRLPTLKPEIVDQMMDSRAVNSTQPESSPPTIDVSTKNWEDGVCRLLIYADDFPQDNRNISRNPEAANIQHGADEIYTGRMATRTKCWLDVEDYSDTDSVAELEYKTWDEARAWEFRNARGCTNVNLSHNSRMDMNREYVSDVDTNTDSDAELDYSTTKCALRTCKCCCAPADFKPVWNSDADTEKCRMDYGLFETNSLRGFVLTTSMGGKTVMGRYMTVWILQNGILSQRIASSRKKETGCRRIVRRRMFRREWFRRRHRT